MTKQHTSVKAGLHMNMCYNQVIKQQVHIMLIKLIRRRQISWNFAVHQSFKSAVVAASNMFYTGQE